MRGDEGETLKAIRLEALADAPFAFGSTYEAECERPAAEWAARARAGADGVERVTFFAERDDGIVGLVGGFRPQADRPVVELVSMWTSPAARRSGVGRALVSAVLDWGRAIGASSVELWVTHGNDAARRLYEAIGFRATGDVQPLPSDPCKDELRMRRVL